MSTYRYRIDSSLRGTTLAPQSFTFRADEAAYAVLRHRKELPGCYSRITDLKTLAVVPIDGEAGVGAIIHLLDPET